LNNPRKKQDPPKAHSALPAVPPAELPRVRRKDFEPYLRAIGPEWDRFERNINPEAGPSTPRASVGSLSGIGGTNKPAVSIDTVPSLFFNSDFDLADPETFASVTEQSEPGSDPLSQAHSQPLLDKFSQYADTIESHLAHEISLRSSSFFSALSNLHTLQSESAACLSQISQLRKLLNDVDEGVAKRGLEVAEVQQKARNVKKVQDGIAGIQQVVETTGIVRNLVSDGKWGEALNIVADIERLWEPVPALTNTKDAVHPNGRLSPLPASPVEDEELLSSSKLSISIPLSSLQAFSALPEHLRTMTVEIASSLSRELASVLRRDIWDAIEGDARNDLRDTLDPLLEGLIKTKGLKEAALSWREIILEQIRQLVIKQVSPSEEQSEESEIPPNSENSGDSEIRLVPQYLCRSKPFTFLL
jgi:vacuolar protein sorting-associated protein 54